MTGATPPLVLEAGVVAYEDGPRVEEAIDSLLSQRLPDHVTLRRIWCVAGGPGSPTVAAAHRCADRDPRVIVLEEPDRRGKSAALSEICQRAGGDLLVLLNGDARAHPGALAAMLEAIRSVEPPFGAMARPVMPRGLGGSMHGPLTMLWHLHHELHAELARRGELDHLSDELLLLPTSALPPFTEGIVNDGTFAARWIRSQGGRLIYADGATVELSPPYRLREHVGQRRRIRLGHRALGARPTWLAFALRDPRKAAEVLRRLLRRPHATRDLAVLLTAELTAAILGEWDGHRRRDYAQWPRVSPVPFPSGEGPGTHVAGR